MTEQLPYVEVNPNQAHDAVVVWLHGLGDSGNGFAPIVPVLDLPDDHRIRFVFPHAPVRPVTINNGMQMRAWYDIKSLDFGSRADIDGVNASAAQVKQLIDAEIEKGIPSDRIILAGFSQGGVIAYHLATQYDKTLAGVLTLSTYMCEPENVGKLAHKANKGTPFMACHGQFDEVVPIYMGKAAYQVMEDLGYNITWHEYGMQHNVCEQELKDISAWLRTRLL
ncbi:alpha/beta hydrolase [Aestuariibacter sp. AA17]|uniref:Alpha/beta hydrolase n=1 Tax=Fluctibacter corallii TaxID=2984329 RepID=A0ABT3ABX1_9ALTE|nr:alpha/beta hydrolase [Aestuariibacter sp. AA17]MCV2886185.1 alpha/beta hydrolase [Aestuariibacter sp. AA17]